jgi:hypothetical protein
MNQHEEFTCMCTRRTKLKVHMIISEFMFTLCTCVYRTQLIAGITPDYGHVGVGLLLHFCNSSTLCRMLS